MGPKSLEERLLERAGFGRRLVKRRPTRPFGDMEAAHFCGKFLGSPPRGRRTLEFKPCAPQPMVSAGTSQCALICGQPQAALEGQFSTAGEECAKAPAEPIQILAFNGVVGHSVRPQQLMIEF